MVTEADYNKWLGWLEAIEADGVNMTTREDEFIGSIRNKFNKYTADNIYLSDRQAEWLEAIYSNRVP